VPILWCKSRNKSSVALSLPFFVHFLADCPFSDCTNFRKASLTLTSRSGSMTMWVCSRPCRWREAQNRTPTGIYGNSDLIAPTCQRSVGFSKVMRSSFTASGGPMLGSAERYGAIAEAARSKALSLRGFRGERHTPSYRSVTPLDPRRLPALN
jgi:hypothetical protein